MGNNTLALGADITRASVVTILDNAVAEYANEKNAQVTGDVDGILLVTADGVTVKDASVSGSLLMAPKAGEATLTVEDSTLKGDLLVETSGAEVSLTGTQVQGEVAFTGDENALTLGKGAKAARVAVDGGKNTIAVAEEASIGTLTARAAVEVDNQGTIDKALIQADGVVLDGNKPGDIQVDEDVDAPTDSEGNPVVDDDQDNGDNGQDGEDNGSGGGSGGSGSGGSGSGGGQEDTLPVVVGVRPVDQDSPETPLPQVTAQAKQEEGFLRVSLSTEDIVPIHQSEGAGKGARVGVAFQAPEGYEEETFRYSFGTEASETADHSADLTQDPAIGDGKYAVFFINASSIAPKTHITLQWGEEAEAVRYEVDLSGVKTPAVELSDVTVSTHELPEGVSSTAEGLSFDESTALVQNGGSGELSQDQISGMGGGEYTVYYAVPQALNDGTLKFDKIARSINGGALNTWAVSSETGAEEGAGWWTKDEDHYFFKWGAVFAKQADGLYQMTDGGIYDYTLYFLESDGSQDNVVATYTFRIDLSGYTISEG